MKQITFTVLSVVGTLAVSGVAFAQEEGSDAAPETEESLEAEPQSEAEATEPESEPEPEPEQAASEESDDEEASGPTSKEGADGARFRFGVQAGAGPMFGKSKPTGESFNFTYGGVDLRLGAQINDLIGVYVTPQLGYYSVGNGTGALGAGGLIGASAGADFTFIDRFFVGAGAGYAVLNNPSGPELHFRLGGYPLMARSAKKVRRKGLMLAADLRVHLLKDYTFVAPTFSIGYEAF